MRYDFGLGYVATVFIQYIFLIVRSILLQGVYQEGERTGGEGRVRQTKNDGAISD